MLTQLSAFWFDLLEEPNQMLSVDADVMLALSDEDRQVLSGRTMWVRRARVVPIECVVRGYLAGSAWTEYRQSGTVCGIRLPAGLVESSVLPEPIFTPATKVESGHDQNISFEEMADRVGRRVAEQLRERSLAVYLRGAKHARERGILIADTKFEWGWWNDELILIDEVLTPDSSRFWAADRYQPGQSPPSFDKQFVRDWLSSVGWDKNSPPPPLPEDIVRKTREKYVEAYERLSGRQFAWK